MPKAMTWAWIRNFFKFRSIIGHQGPLAAKDPDCKGSKYNLQVEWETGEITFEPLSIIAADDPVICAAHAKENDLLALEGWCRFRNLAKKGQSPCKGNQAKQDQASQEIPNLHVSVPNPKNLHGGHAI